MPQVADSGAHITKVTQNSSGIRLINSHPEYGGSQAYITLQYTKTTDPVPNNN